MSHWSKAATFAAAALGLGVSHPVLSVNKCTLADGQVAYQDAPCSTGARSAVVKITRGNVLGESVDRPDEIRAAIAAKEMMIGMLAGEARKAWGDPHAINVTIRAGGRLEQWVYRRPGAPGGQYVYLENGVVTSIQSSH